MFTVVVFWNSIKAQTADPKVDQTNAWITYTGNHKITEKWGVHAEFQWRRNHLIQDPMQDLIRFGVDYTVNSKVTVSGGWCYVDSYEYGELGNADQATKYNQLPFAGESAASIAASPGELMGVGGSPVTWYVLYGESVFSCSASNCNSWIPKA